MALALVACWEGTPSPAPATDNRIGAATSLGSSSTSTPSASVRDRSSAGTSPDVGVARVVSYQIAECGEPPLPVGFAVLCETFDAVDELYVEPVEPSALAAAAALGIRRAPGIGDGEPSSTEITCHIPDPAFEVVCEALVERLADGGGSSRHLLEFGVQGMFRFGLDPFSVYMPPSASPPASLLAGFVYELGMVVSARTEDGTACGPIGGDCRFRVVSVFAFTPAAQAGIEEGEVLVAVDGAPVDGLAGEEAALLLRGPSGTMVSLTLERDADVVDVSMERAEVRMESAEFEMLDGGIAYVRLNDFSQSASIALGSALGRTDVQQSRGLILDLRDNPGGLVLAAQAVASQFLPSGDVMTEQYRTGEFTIPVVEGGLATEDPPLVVLVNGASASAAEIVAAVLSERGRATVVGTPTFGKNLVQSVLPGPVGGEIRVTTARWTTPEGRDVGLVGLTPDIEVETDSTGDAQLRAAIDLLD